MFDGLLKKNIEKKSGILYIKIGDEPIQFTP